MVTSYTHGLVGLGLGKVFTGRRLPWLFWLLALVLPILPDVDVFSRAAYGSTWGHRGFTHSLVFALGLALVAALPTFRYFKISFWILWSFFFVITATHGVLDACTKGGEGIPLLWPFYDHRFGPWGPILVSDLGFEWPDPRRSRALRDEMLWVWLPLAVLVGIVMLWRRWRRAATKNP